MNDPLVKQILHYQLKLQNAKEHDNIFEMLRCVKKLSNLPITLKELEETGIGKTINSLRKYNGELGDCSNYLVTLWKKRVKDEIVEQVDKCASDHSATDRDDDATDSEQIDDDVEPIKKVNEQNVPTENSSLSYALVTKEGKRIEQKDYHRVIKHPTADEADDNLVELKKRKSDSVSSAEYKKMKTDIKEEKQSDRHKKATERKNDADNKSIRNRPEIDSACASVSTIKADVYKSEKEPHEFKENYGVHLSAGIKIKKEKIENDFVSFENASKGNISSADSSDESDATDSEESTQASLSVDRNSYSNDDDDDCTNDEEKQQLEMMARKKIKKEPCDEYDTYRSNRPSVKEKQPVTQNVLIPIKSEKISSEQHKHRVSNTSDSKHSHKQGNRHSYSETKSNHHTSSSNKDVQKSNHQVDLRHDNSSKHKDGQKSDKTRYKQRCPPGDFNGEQNLKHSSTDSKSRSSSVSCDEDKHHGRKNKNHDKSDKRKSQDKSDKHKDHHKSDKPKSHHESDKSKSHHESDKPKSHHESDKLKSHHESDKSKSHRESDKLKSHHKDKVNRNDSVTTNDDKHRNSKSSHRDKKHRNSSADNKQPSTNDRGPQKTDAIIRNTSKDATRYDDRRKRKENESLPPLDNAGGFGAALLEISSQVAAACPKKKSLSSKLGDSSSPCTSSQNFVEVDVLSDDTDTVGALEIDLSDDDYDSYSQLNDAEQKKANAIAEQDALISVMTTKYQKTKVFSGSKTKNSSRLPSLFELCSRVLQDNFDCLEYTGGVPYMVIKPILEKTTAEQLANFERYNSYLLDDSDELWEFHVKQHFRNAVKNDYESWRDLYQRCINEREEKLQSLRDNINLSIANSVPVRKTKLAFVDHYVKPPRNVAKQQAVNGINPGVKVAKKPSNELQPSVAGIQAVKERIEAANRVLEPAPAASKSSLLLKKKPAPLMQKALQLMKGSRYRR